jgi:hypothetical protein
MNQLRRGIMKFKAFWLHTNGEVIHVSSTHIAEVIKSPELFGYTRERIVAEYSTYREPMGHEGKVRHKIMADLIINSGWIRLRYNPRHDLWIVELKTYRTSEKTVLADFFSKPENVGTFQHSTVKITELCLSSCNELELI